MRNIGDWSETKFIRDRRGKWRANRTEVPVGSRLITDIVAAAYYKPIAAYATGRLVDLGCGKVPLYGMYCDQTTEIVCVDWPGSLHGSEHVDVLADLNEPLDLPADSFDTAIATDVLEHLYAPAIFLTSAVRILKPGGKLIIGVPFFYWIHEAPHDYYRYTRFALERLVMQAGLEVIQLEPYGGPAEALCDLVTKTLGRTPGLTLTIEWLSRTFLRLPTVSGHSGARRETMPMGYVLVGQKPPTV